MLGFKKRHQPQPRSAVADAMARLQAAEAALALSPADPSRREEFRLAHNAVAQLLSVDSPAS